MEIQRTVAEPKQHSGDELAVVGQDHDLRAEPQDGGHGVWCSKPLGPEDGSDAELARNLLDGGWREPLIAPRGPGRRSDDTGEFDVRVRSEAPQGFRAECAAPEEDRPNARAVGSLAGHARAPVASRTSASSSFPAPTAISSSIESR